MKRLIETSVTRPVLVTTLSLVLCALAFVRFPIAAPDARGVVIVTQLPGASAQELDTRITQKIAGAVGALAGVEALGVQSSAGVSRVTVQLASEDVAREIHERVDALRPQLPADSEPPRIERVEEDTAPVMSIAVHAQGRDIRSITEHASRVLREGLLNVRDVAQIDVLGGRARQLNVVLRPFHMHGLGLDASAVARALNDQTLTRSVGHVHGMPLRLHGRFKGVEDVQQAVLKHDGGRLVRLADVAAVEEGVAAWKSAAVWNGQRSVLLNVRKRASADTLVVVDALQARLEVLRRELPLGYSVDVVRDAASELRASTRAQLGKIALAGVLAALAVWMLLGRFRGAFIAALVAPVPALAALAWLDGVAWLALVVTVTSVVLVLDNISRRVDGGEQPPHAAVLGAREMVVPVLASTLTLTAVHLLSGAEAGGFWVACTWMIVASLWSSLCLTPMLAARWLSSHARGVRARASVDVLSWCLQRRWLVALTVLGAWLVTWPQLAKLEGSSLFNAHPARLEVRVHLPEDRSAAATEVEAERIARDIRRLPEVTDTLLTVAQDEPHLARISVTLVSSSQHTAVQATIRRQILAKLPAHVRASLGQDAVASTPQSSLHVDRERAAALGVHVADIAQSLQLLASGQEVSTYTHAGQSYAVHMRVDAEPLHTEEALRMLTVPSSTRGAISLADLVKQAPDAVIHTTHVTHSAFAGENVLYALALMYVLLAVLLESWWQPLTVLLSSAATVPAALLSVRLFDHTPTYLLLGLATTTAVVQLDRIRQLRALGEPRLRAILQSHAEVLRPILTITLASIACTLPWLADGSSLLLTALITLLVTPVIYTCFDDLRFGTAPAPQPVVIESAPLGAE